MQETNFWLTEPSKHHITPRTISSRDESFLLQYSNLDIIDFGCGEGRLAHYFRPDKYVGYDINEVRIGVARTKNPKYWFTTDIQQLPKHKTLLMFAVALHINDWTLLDIRTKLKPSRVIICESLNNPNNFGWDGAGMACYRRGLEDYEHIFNKKGEVVYRAPIDDGEYLIDFVELSPHPIIINPPKAVLRTS